MPFLSRVEINPARRGTRKLLASPQAMHAAVLAAFPPSSHQKPDKEGRVLWRLDQGHSSTVLYVVSPELPDFTHLIEQAGWPQTTSWDSREYGPFISRLKKGQIFGYRLTANPTRSAPTTDKTGKPSRGKVYGHVTADQQLRWLLDRQSALGCELSSSSDNSHNTHKLLIETQLIERRRVVFSRAGRRVTLDQATFQGILRVSDPQKLGHALVHGIGRAKAYGCGLLTLAPVSSQ